MTQNEPIIPKHKIIQTGPVNDKYRNTILEQATLKVQFFSN